MSADELPIFRVPPELLGASKRHRRQDLLISCRGSIHNLGWILFGNDGSLYFHRKGELPVTHVGVAVSEGGKLTDKESLDVSDLPLQCRKGTHLSLHPGGEVHIKSGGGKKLCVGNIGPWLPVREAFSVAYVFTEPVGNLPTVDSKKRSPRLVQVPDPNSSLRLEVIVAPLTEYDGRSGVLSEHSTILVGLSPKYGVRLNAAIHPPCEPRIFFLYRS